jgi:hypothetical protein
VGGWVNGRINPQGNGEEDLFEPSLFVEMLNGAYSLTKASKVSLERLDSTNVTSRIVKKAEALFRLMPDSVPEFSHYGLARWLLENPSFLNGDSPGVAATFTRFEDVFKKFNSLLA